jgi:hypothetical protein
MTAEDVDEDHEEQVDPDDEEEDLQHGPKDAEQRVGVGKHVFIPL